MKKFALISAFLATSFLSALPAIADPVATPSRPRSRTEPALACLLGMASNGCQNVFFDGRSKVAVTRSKTDCAREYILEPVGDRSGAVPANSCVDGPLDAVDYLGTNAAGDDLYEVQYRHADTIYFIAAPGPGGKVGQFRIIRGNPKQAIPTSKAPSSDAHKIAFYRRPWKR